MKRAAVEERRGAGAETTAFVKVVEADDLLRWVLLKKM